MIELFEQDLKTDDRQSSKGNQLKWKKGNIWYKADHSGYEGLAEYIVSHLLQKSTLSQNEYVLYQEEQIKYKYRVFNGVKSYHFLDKVWQIITLERLFYQQYQKSLYTVLWEMKDVKKRLLFLVDIIERMTGLKDFGKYINKLFTIDALFLNEDRHMHNIAVLMNSNGDYDFCPIFDNGASVLSDTRSDYPLNVDYRILMKDVQSKSISTDFDDQLDVSEELFGENIKFSFSAKDVNELLNQITIYTKEEKERVLKILEAQMYKYQYLFS